MSSEKYVKDISKFQMETLRDDKSLDPLLKGKDKRIINRFYRKNKKVPFIIWTRDKNFNKTVDTPMGMIDVLPTLGNMLGIHSDYQLGNDIFNLKDNVVTFIDGSYLTSNIYYSAPKGEIYPISNDPITEEYIQNGIEHSSNLIDISNDIISYDLIKELKEEKSN